MGKAAPYTPPAATSSEDLADFAAVVRMAGRDSGLTGFLKDGTPALLQAESDAFARVREYQSAPLSKERRAAALEAVDAYRRAMGTAYTEAVKAGWELPPEALRPWTRDSEGLIRHAMAGSRDTGRLNPHLDRNTPTPLVEQQREAVSVVEGKKPADWGQHPGDYSLGLQRPAAMEPAALPEEFSRGLRHDRVADAENPMVVDVVQMNNSQSFRDVVAAMGARYTEDVIPPEQAAARVKLIDRRSRAETILADTRKNIEGAARDPQRHARGREEGAAHAAQGHAAHHQGAEGGAGQDREGGEGLGEGQRRRDPHHPRGPEGLPRPRVADDGDLDPHPPRPGAGLRPAAPGRRPAPGPARAARRHAVVPAHGQERDGPERQRRDAGRRHPRRPQRPCVRALAHRQRRPGPPLPVEGRGPGRGRDRARAGAEAAPGRSLAGADHRQAPLPRPPAHQPVGRQPRRERNAGPRRRQRRRARGDDVAQAMARGRPLRALLA